MSLWPHLIVSVHIYDWQAQSLCFAILCEHLGSIIRRFCIVGYWRLSYVYVQTTAAPIELCGCGRFEIVAWDTVDRDEFCALVKSHALGGSATSKRKVNR
jgi:hypothetical protein